MPSQSREAVRRLFWPSRPAPLAACVRTAPELGSALPPRLVRSRLLPPPAIFLVSRVFLPQIRVFHANSVLLAGEPNQENGAEEYLTMQIPPISLAGAWLVRFFDARELRYAPKFSVRLDCCRWTLGRLPAGPGSPRQRANVPRDTASACAIDDALPQRDCPRGQCRPHHANRPHSSRGGLIPG